MNINTEIKNQKIKIVTNDFKGDYSLTDALFIAKQHELDLVEVSTQNDLSICKIMDYEKFLYQQEKNKPKQKTKEIKEIRLTPNISPNDLNTKKRHCIEFLKQGHNLKIIMIFKGREIQTCEKIGQSILLQLVNDLSEYGKATSMPKFENNKYIININQIKNS